MSIKTKGKNQQQQQQTAFSNMNNGSSILPPGFGFPPLPPTENGKIFNPPLLMANHQSMTNSSSNSNSSSSNNKPNSSNSNSRQQPPVHNNNNNNNNNSSNTNSSSNNIGESSALKQLRDIADRSSSNPMLAVAASNMLAAGQIPNQHLLNEFTKMFESQVKHLMVFKLFILNILNIIIRLDLVLVLDFSTLSIIIFYQKI